MAQVGNARQAQPHREHNPFSLLGARLAIPIRKLNDPDPFDHYRIGAKTVGMGLTRDSLVSVMYAEELNSAKSSVTLQRTDRHGILDQKPANFQLSL